MNHLLTVLKSASFSNFSTMYLKYLKYAGWIGVLIGLGGSIAYLSDCNRKNKREKERIMSSRNITNENLLTDTDLERCENSNLHNFSFIVGGTILGISGFIMWPIVVTLGPIYYAFGDYLGSIVASILAISASIVTEKDNNIEDKKNKYMIIYLSKKSSIKNRLSR